MLNAFASLKCSKNASIMYKSLVVLLNKLIALFAFSSTDQKNSPLFTLLNQLGPVYVEVGDSR